MGTRTDLTNQEKLNHTEESKQEEAAFKAYCDQEDIGWDHFLLGNLSIKWKQAMESHYAQLAAASDEKLLQESGPRNCYVMFFTLV